MDDISTRTLVSETYLIIFNEALQKYNMNIYNVFKYMYRYIMYIHVSVYIYCAFAYAQDVE